MKYIIALLFLISLPAFAQEGPCAVSRVIDGDTFVCTAHGESYKVRLIGCDTPELPTPEGIEAKEYVEEIMPVGTIVRLELDVGTYDRYQRILAYVYLPSGDMLNEVLLREGVAALMTVPPNVAKLEALKEAAGVN